MQWHASLLVVEREREGVRLMKGFVWYDDLMCLLVVVLCYGGVVCCICSLLGYFCFWFFGDCCNCFYLSKCKFLHKRGYMCIVFWRGQLNWFNRHKLPDGCLFPVFPLCNLLCVWALGGSFCQCGDQRWRSSFLPCGVSYLECGCMPVEDCWFTVTLCVLVKFIDLCGECVSGLSLFCLFSSGDS